MKCLVTGAAGFVGSHLSEELVNLGNAVVGVDCFTDYYPKSVKLSNLKALRKMRGFEFIEGDLSTMNLGRPLADVDWVFHLAAQPGVRGSWGKTFSHYVRENIVAMRRLLDATRTLSIKKFVYASSSSIYGDSERIPTSEDSPPKPVSPYGVTKLAGEHLCHAYRKNYLVPTVVLRYFTVYGPRQRPDMAFNRFISSISRGRPIEVYGDGEQTRDFTFVRDTVAGTVLAAKARPGTVYNIGAGRTASLNSVISTIASVLGKEAKVSRRKAAPGDVTSTSADISRIESDLGYRPRVSLADGLSEQIAFQTG